MKKRIMKRLRREHLIAFEREAVDNTDLFKKIKKILTLN